MSDAIDAVIAAIMARATAASGTAVFLDPVILGDLLAPLERELAEARALVEWQGHELSKRMACQKCGREPGRHDETYPTVCVSCRRCYECAEPMCPTCGDKTGTKQRAIDLLRENATLTEQRDGYLAEAGEWQERMEAGEAEARAEVEAAFRAGWLERGLLPDCGMPPVHSCAAAWSRYQQEREGER